jgi:hypothetical protein
MNESEVLTLIDHTVHQGYVFLYINRRMLRVLRQES